jgi:DNA repair exonuclease SbcCD nuclease subunit
MAFTFLHAADIHLDSPLKGLERYENAPADRIRGATRRAFARLVDLAIDKRVDFVLIAGDLYDGDWRDYQTGLYLARELARLRDCQIPVFVIAGNHDAANKMTRVLRLPDNVKVLAHDRPETAFLPDLDVAIHGQSFAKAAVTENLAVAYPAPISGCLNIGLLHTGLGGLEGHARYAPCTLDELKSRGYNYWALGHIHTRQEHSAEPHVVFAGNVQGRHIRETGPKGCYLVTVHSDQHIDLQFERLDCVRWERGRVALELLDTESDALSRVATLLDDLLASEPDPDAMLAVRVSITGATEYHAKLHANPDQFLAEVRSLATDRGGDRLWIERVEPRTLAPRTETVADGALEELLHVLEQARTDPDALKTVIDDLTELKRKLPAELIQDPEGPRLDETDWLRSLLAGVEPLLFSLLRKPDGATIDVRGG